MQVCNNMMLSKWEQNVHFCINFSFTFIQYTGINLPIANYHMKHTKQNSHSLLQCTLVYWGLFIMICGWFSLIIVASIYTKCRVTTFSTYFIAHIQFRNTSDRKCVDACFSVVSFVPYRNTLILSGKLKDLKCWHLIDRLHTLQDDTHAHACTLAHTHSPCWDVHTLRSHTHFTAGQSREQSEALDGLWSASSEVCVRLCISVLSCTGQ